MSNKVQITPEERKVISKILQDLLPSNSHVWVFGSRAKGPIKPFSDLDFAIDIGQPLSLDLLADLRFAFDESSLPYQVDIVDLNTISPNFLHIIDSHKIPFLLSS